MPSIDMPLDQLRHYKPSIYRQQDFESFWEETTRAAIRQPLNAELIPYNLPLKNTQVYAVRFDGFQGGRLAGWYLRPDAAGKSPGLCVYHGYGQRGPRPLDLLQYSAQGFCVLSMDCRGQNGQSQDAAVYPEGHSLGWMTAGIRDPRTYYYRYVYADALRALEVLAHRDEVDADRVAITGVSQGGGLTLAIAALSKRPALALADIPFLCDFRRAIQISPASPYNEFATFFKAFPQLYEQSMQTLSYFDCVNLAAWIRCRTLVSNCLCDDICPPSTIYGAYNHITAEKHIEVFPFHKHEVPYDHAEARLRLLQTVLGN